MLELRIRACHATGAFAAKNNRKGIVSGLDRIQGPPRFNYDTAGASAGDLHAGKAEDRGAPAGGARLHRASTSSTRPSTAILSDIGIVVMGGLTNSVLRALERMGLADVFGASRVPIKVLNVVYPLVPDEIRAFCATKRAVLVVEEGHPDYIEQAINVELRRADIQTKVLGKGRAAAGRRIYLRRAARRPRRVPASGQACRHRRRHRRRTGARADRAQGQSRRRARAHCRRARRPSAPAARNARCSPRSS